MARIRSVHPGIYTDESFATLSMAARVLIIGIWNHADDGGGFEWKPLSLKMKIFPADNIDVSELLSELEAGDVIKKYEVDGKSYGAVRNFGKWQRPKKPSRFCPMPESVRNYACTNDDKNETGSEPEASDTANNGNQFRTSSEPVPNQYGNSISEGRKGGRKEGKSYTSSLRSDGAAMPPRDVSAPGEPIAPEPSPDVRTQLFSEGLRRLRGITGQSEGKSRALIGRWLKAKHDDASEVLRAIREAADLRPSDPVAWMEAAMRPKPRAMTRDEQVRATWGNIEIIPGT